MKKLFKFSLLVFMLAVCLCSESHAQSYMPGVTFKYDNVGNRIVRTTETICLGLGCPVDYTAPKPAKDTAKDNELSSDAILIDAYPNPVDLELSIVNRSWKDGDKATVFVYDISGKVVIKKELLQAKDNIQFKDIIPGTYMVQYYLNGNAERVWKIIKP